MKRGNTMVLATLTALLAASTATAEPTGTQKIDKRQARQEKRIQQGVAGGQLTTGEAAKLEQQQEKIRAAEDAATSDGVVTRKERKKLHKMQDRASEKIYRKKHNSKEVQ